MTKAKKSLRTIKGEDVYPGDTVKISTHIVELNEDFVQEGILKYNSKEDYFHFENTPEVELNIWDRIELVKPKNAKKTAKSDK